MDDIREKVEKKIYSMLEYRLEQDHLRKELSINIANQILNIKRSRGGGVCDYCKEFARKGQVYHLGCWFPCPTCKGTGQKPIETKTLDQIRREWEDGKDWGE